MVGRTRPAAASESASSAPRRFSSGVGRSWISDHGDLPLLGLLRIDLREPAAGRADRRRTGRPGRSPRRQRSRLPRPRHRRPRRSRRRRPHRSAIRPAGLRVVDRDIRAELPSVAQLSLAASSGDDSSTGAVGERHQPGTDAATGSGDQHRLAGPHRSLRQPADGHVAVVQRRQRRGQVQALRHVEELLGRNGHAFRVAAPVVRAGTARAGHDPATHLVWIDAVADGDHRARNAGTGHERRPDVEVLAPPAAPQLRVEEQDLRQGDLDDRLPRPRDGLRRLTRHQHLGSAELGYLHHPHGLSPAGRWSQPHGRS